MPRRLGAKRLERQNTGPVELILETAVNFSEMFDLPCPSRVEMYVLPPEAVVDQFWWRLHARSHVSHFLRVPSWPKDWKERYPCEDRRTCLECIVGCLAGRLPDQRQLCLNVLMMGAGTWSDALKSWRSRSQDYRWMMAHLAGDLKHRALRELVLGYRNASPSSP